MGSVLTGDPHFDNCFFWQIKTTPGRGGRDEWREGGREVGMERGREEGERRNGGREGGR